MSSAPQTWTLSVNRGMFLKALRTVAKAGTSLRKAEATITLDCGELVIELAGISHRVPVAGSWPGEVRLAGTALQKLARTLPPGDPITIAVSQKTMTVQRFSVVCTVTAGRKRAPTLAREMLPANADLFDVLMVLSRCTDEEIEAAGAAPLVLDAGRRMADLCARAARILSDYGVSGDDLLQLCARHVEHGSRQFRESEKITIKQVAEVWRMLAPLGVHPAEIKQLMDLKLRRSWKR